MKVLFNRTPLAYGKSIDAPSKELVKNTLGLFRASVEDAIRFGGDLTRTALGAMPIQNSRRYVVVDVKVHMLMPGFLPAIPGWHSDGVPRPAGKDKPDLRLQEDARPTIYHLLVTGEGCLTQFLTAPIELEVPDEPSPDLYKLIDKQLGDNPPNLISAPSCQALTWDWWTLHRGIQATKHEWRYLIRVAETDTLAPLTDLRDVLRTQQQVYVPLNFGW